MQSGSSAVLEVDATCAQEAAGSVVVKRVRERNSLASHEMDTVRFVVRGLSDKEVCEKLFLSPDALATRLGNIFRKLEISTRTELIQMGNKKGWGVTPTSMSLY